MYSSTSPRNNSKNYNQYCYFKSSSICRGHQSFKKKLMLRGVLEKSVSRSLISYKHGWSSKISSCWSEFIFAIISLDVAPLIQVCTWKYHKLSFTEWKCLES